MRRTDPREPRTSASQAGEVLGVGLQFAGAIVLFLFVGRWLDARLGTEPWLLLTGVMVGAAAGFISLYRQLVVAPAGARAAPAGGGRGVMRSGLAFTGVSAVVAALVALLGGSVVAAPGRAECGPGWASPSRPKSSSSGSSSSAPSPSRRLLAHLVGMLGRLLVFGVAALVWIPRWGLPPAPTLFSLVTVFFVTTLAESRFVRSQESSTRR